jgi:two-component system cell cycle sensor histidine kinase/response regulator CckA
VAVDPPPRVLPAAVLDAMAGAVAQLSADGEILSANAAWQALAAQFHLLPGTNVTPGSNYLDECTRAASGGNAAAGAAASAIREVLDGRRDPIFVEFNLPGTDGAHWFELLVTRLAGDGFSGALVTYVEISNRKAADEALHRSEAQYRAIVESAPVGIYQTRLDGRIVAANQSLADIVRVPSPEHLIGRNILEYYANPAERDELIRGNWHGKAGGPVEVEWKREDGVPIWVQMAARSMTDAAGRTAFFEGFIYDISERKRLEAQLVQAQKMESVGRLAGGIAHDFNNLLTVMIGYAELLHTSSDMPLEFRAAIGEILAAARRAAELTGRMLAFARKQRVQPRAVNVNDVVRNVDGLLRRIIGEDVRLDLRLSSELGPVLIDPAQLEQVLMNLAVNARDAMPAGGTLTITTGLVDVSEDEARRRPGLRAGHHVRVAVTDTGIGMDSETLARIFEPFFTTKDPGKGTGLGLAMCYGIVKQANGFIGCESRKGAGTTCSVLLPPIAADAEHAAADDPATLPPHAPVTTRGTILVVEDEAVVRRFVAEILQASGHVVQATGSAQEGLGVAAQVGRTLDLLVTDVVMPQMDGVTLASKIRAHNPDLRVLLISGYGDRPVPEDDTRFLLLEKPFTAAQLRARVEEALRRGASGGDRPSRR